MARTTPAQKPRGWASITLIKNTSPANGVMRLCAATAPGYRQRDGCPGYFGSDWMTINPDPSEPPGADRTGHALSGTFERKCPLCPACGCFGVKKAGRNARFQADSTREIIRD